MEIFERNDYKEISKFIEKKIPMLRENADFNEKYLRLTDIMEELEKTLQPEQLEKFHEIVKLFYQTEEYYFAFSYLLGAKHGKEIEKI